MYYPANVTSGLPADIVGVCLQCTSVIVCTGLLRILLTVIGLIACVAILSTVVVCAYMRGICRRTQTKAIIDSVSADRLYSPRYITNGHIIAGLSTKPLLGSNSESSDECEEPSD